MPNKDGNKCQTGLDLEWPALRLKPRHAQMPLRKGIMKTSACPFKLTSPEHEGIVTGTAVVAAWIIR